ncbi:MAG TPA: hypothetical protein VGM91_14185 [Conexibacter sp.]|jgi:hypothetical protein
MKIVPADPLTRARTPKRQDRFPSFRLLESLSLFHSCVYAALLFFWLGPDNRSATMVLGWAHGVLWIGMALLCIVAARHRTIPFWLAVLVAVIGGLGPFAGTIGFLWEQRRRTRQTAVQPS